MIINKITVNVIRVRKTVQACLSSFVLWGIPLAMALTACMTEPAIVPVPTATSVALPTATSLPPTLAPPTPAPTEALREFVTYSDPNNVFSLAIPDDWTARVTPGDRLMVSFEPPMGYASRVFVDVTNEGPMTPEEVRALVDGYLRLRYTEDPRYVEISRADLPDGRLQVTFLYSDGRGAAGREIVYLQQVGPYFAVLRVFLSDKDVLSLSGALESVAESFTIDPLSIWGGQPSLSSVDPDDLRLFHVYAWADSSENFYVMGEIYNASPTDVAFVTVDVTICDVSGVELVSASNVIQLDVLERGGFAPFVVLAQGIPAEATACVVQARAEPADYTPYTALSLEQTGSRDAYGQLAVSGTVTNDGLEVVNQIQVLIAVYDIEDHVIGYGVVNLGETSLPPGEMLPFEYTFEALGGDATHFVTWVQADVILGEG